MKLINNEGAGVNEDKEKWERTAVAEETTTSNTIFKFDKEIELQERKRIMKWLEQFEKPSLYVDTRTFRIPDDELEKMIREGK